MTVRDLIFSTSIPAIAAFYVSRLDKKPDDIESCTRQMEEFIFGLRTIEPVDTNHILLGVRYIEEDGEFLNPCLFRKPDLAESFNQDSMMGSITTLDGLSEEEVAELAKHGCLHDKPVSYAFEFSPWKEILGYEVDGENAREVGPVELCVAILWEMTLFGLDEAAVDAEREEMHRCIQEVEEISKLPPEEQQKHFVSVDLDSELPEQTEEEKQAFERRTKYEMAENCLRTWRALRGYLDRHPLG